MRDHMNTANVLKKGNQKRLYFWHYRDVLESPLWLKANSEKTYSHLLCDSFHLSSKTKLLTIYKTICQITLEAYICQVPCNSAYKFIGLTW